MDRKSIKYEKRIIRNILKNTLDTSSFIFSSLIGISEITIDVFLKPSYYGDLPSGKIIIDNSSRNIKEVKIRTIKQSMGKLQKYGFVEKKDNNYLLSSVGKKLASYILKRKKALDKKWDKKYRVVIFDVPEKQRRDRNWLRNELYFLNYKQLQKSVFISKCPITEDLIKEIKRKKLGNFVNYLLVDRVYNNRW